MDGRRIFRDPRGVAATILTLFPLLAHAQELTLEVTNPNGQPTRTVQQAVPFYITVTLSSAQQLPNSDPIIDHIKDLDVCEPRPVSTRITIINGHQTVSRVYQYKARYDTTGTHALGPAHYETGTHYIQSNPIVLTVSPCTNTNEHVHTSDPCAILNTKQKSVYIGQQIDLAFYVCYEQEISRCQLEPFTIKNANIEPCGEPVHQKVSVGATTYDALVYRFSCYPTASGQLVIPQLRAIVERERKEEDSFFAHFRSFFTRDDERIPVNSHPQTITVKPLPRGPQMVNGVGNFDHFQLEADTTRAREAQGITLSMSLAGTGDIAHVNLPTLELPSSMRAYPAGTKISVDAKNPLQKIRTYKTVLQALKPGTITIQAHTLCIFNPDKERYEQLRTQPLTITFEPENSLAPKTQDSIKLAHVPTKLPKIPHPLFIFLLIIPLFAMLAVQTFAPYKSHAKRWMLLHWQAYQIKRACKALQIKRVYELWFTWFETHAGQKLAHQQLHEVGKLLITNEQEYAQWCDYVNAIKKEAFSLDTNKNNKTICTRTKQWLVYLQENP